MNNFPTSGLYGTFHTVYNEGKSYFINYNIESLKMYEYETLKEVGEISFKTSIATVLFPKTGLHYTLKFIVVCEDQYAHIVLFKKMNFKIIQSTDLCQSVNLTYTCLSDKALHLYILSENGVVTSVQKKNVQKRNLSWPPKNMTKIKRFENCYKFAGQKCIARNSAAFLAFHYMGDSCLISSWIYDFDTGEIMNGPFTVTVSPQSFYISTNYYVHDNAIYSICPHKNIGPSPNIIASSNFSSDYALIADTKNDLYRITDEKIQKIASIQTNILRIESNGLGSYIIITSDGVLTNGKQKLQLQPTVNMDSYCNLLAIATPSGTKFMPTKESSPESVKTLTIDKQKIMSLSGGKYSFPGTIVSHYVKRIENYDYVIVATAGTIHILKSHLKNPSILPITEKNWSNSIACVALTKTLFAVADVTNTITVKNYSGDDYEFKFTSSLCNVISLSDESLICGFVDGSIIISSLEQKQAISTIRPFRNVMLTSVKHLPEEGRYILSWPACTAELSNNTFAFMNVPEFPSGNKVCFENGLLTIMKVDSLEVYRFADKSLLCKVQISCIDIDSCKRRIAILTIKNELLIIYFHKNLAVETQSLLDIVDPISVHISGKYVYIVGKNCVYIYEFSGKLIETLSFTQVPRCASSSQCSIFICFTKFIWLIDNENKVTKISHDKSNIQRICAVDDTKCVISTPSLVIVADVKANSFNVIAKHEKKLLALRCFSSSLMNDGVIDKVGAYFADNTIALWDIDHKK